MFLNVLLVDQEHIRRRRSMGYAPFSAAMSRVLLEYHMVSLRVRPSQVYAGQDQKAAYNKQPVPSPQAMIQQLCPNLAKACYSNLQYSN